MSFNNISITEIIAGILIGLTLAALIPMWLFNLVAFIRAEYFYNPEKEKMATMKEVEEHFRRLYAKINRLQNDAGEKSKEVHLW